MYSCLRDILTLVMLTASTSSLLAEEIDIKLNCQISLTTNSSAGISEKSQLTELVEVYQSGNFLTILSTSTNLGSVSTKASDRGYKVTNLSDSNKWNLTNEKSPRLTQFIVDRNTGQIYYSDYFTATNGIVIRSQGNGTCRKIDTDKKLF